MALIIFVLVYLMVNQSKTKSDIQHMIKEETFQNQTNTKNNFVELSDRLDLSMRDVLERNTNFEREVRKELQTFTNSLSKELTDKFDKQHEVIEYRLNLITNKVNESLDQGFEKTQKTFTNIVERLSKIDEAQKKIETLSTEIGSLQDVLTDKSSRGAFGEIQLNQILSSIFGEKNDRLYQLQYTFSTGSRSDAVLFAPEPLGTVAIDAKFPLENYRKLIEVHPKSSEFVEIRRLFISDIKNHIDTIASKYIITHETSDQALMFIPAEAIFAYINAYHPELITYAQKKRIWIVSPTTLMSTLTTLQTILINMERDKYSQEIQKELTLLQVEFGRYKERWDKLSGHLDQVGKDVKEIHTTTDKITKRFESIANVENTRIEEK